MKEFELTVLLTKSRSGSFGFTVTRSKLDNCYYIQEILDNPAKADGRLRAGDRLITVREPHVHAHTLLKGLSWQNVLTRPNSSVSFSSGERTRCYQCGRRCRHDDSQVIAEAAEYDAGEGSHKSGGTGSL